MSQDLIDKGYIPFDKSWMIRMGILDLLDGYDDSIRFLESHYDELSDDLKSLHRASIQWGGQRTIDVGESATLYRYLRFASWKLGKNKEFVLQGTLKTRNICDDPSIINLSLEELLKLDNGTSQWASAAVLIGNREIVSEPPYKLQVTYDAVEHWESMRERGEIWKPRFDETILAQASAYLQWLEEGKMDFTPQQAEDYCFSRAFNLMTAEEGERRWSSLKGHESDRITEMERELQERIVITRDHRVIQAIAMLRQSKANFVNPGCVNKSWPQFWRFLENSSDLL